MSLQSPPEQNSILYRTVIKDAALAEQKQHKSAGGLPCELSPEEVALALRSGAE